MAEQAEAIVEQSKPSPFDEGKVITWDDLVNNSQSKNNQQSGSSESQQQQKPAETQVPAFDVNAFIKENFGYENVDAAKQDFTELKKLKDQPPAQVKPTYANEESERFANLIAEGKLDEANDIINQQKSFKKLSELDVTNKSNAEQVLKAHLQNKYKELQPDEIDYLMQEKYLTPEKPEQALDQTQDEYDKALASWQKKVDMIEKRMSIDAKLAKPELAKLQKEIVLPDIPKQQAQPQLDQKELDLIAQRRQQFEQALTNDSKNFNGFSTTVKDKDVEIPINYTATPEEQTALATKLKDFDVVNYFSNRWFDKDGKPNVPKMMEDLTLLENPGNVFKKFANEGASKRLEKHIAEQSNLDLSGKNGGRTTQSDQQQQSANAQKSLDDAIWQV